MGGRVRSEDREHVSAGLHQWETWDQVSEWGWMYWSSEIRVDVMRS